MADACRICLFWLTFIAAPVLAESIPPPVSEALRAAGIPASHVAIVVQPAGATSPLVAHNDRLPMNPASVMKLLTTYAALDLLGPAHTWQTDALAVTPVRSDGVLPGPLVLKGGGDPKFLLEHLSALLRQLRMRGVRHIAGDLVLDRSAFAVAVLDPAAFDDRPMRPYNAGPDALLVNFRSLAFTLQPDGGKVRLLQGTPSEGLLIDNRLQSAAGECGTDWKDRLGVRWSADGRRLEFAGHYASACGERSVHLAPLAADAQVGGLFRALWAELGGSHDGRVLSGSTPAGARLLARHESPPLADVVRDINKYSNNVMARQLFLALAGTELPATESAARKRIDDWLKARGLHFDELSIENGSGLSRSDRISAGSLNRLLQDGWKSPVMPEWLASLPIVGIDGTMKKRLRNSGATGRARIKGGTLDGVRSLAGFALDANGRPVAVTFLINHPRAAAGQAALDALLLWVATAVP